MVTVKIEKKMTTAVVKRVNKNMGRCLIVWEIIDRVVNKTSGIELPSYQYLTYMRWVMLCRRNQIILQVHIAINHMRLHK